MLTVSAGLIGLVLVGGRTGRKDLPALGAAVLTGLVIAAGVVLAGVMLISLP